MNKRGASLMEVLFVIALFTVWIVPFMVMRLWMWAWTFLGIAVVFGFWEIFSSIKTGKTLSKRFWLWKDIHPIGAWVIMACMFTGWIMLLGHLIFEWPK